MLPQAQAATALALNAYNTYGMQVGGYAANAGGYGGFNETVSYAYTPNNYANLWPASYDNLEDYQYVINKTDGDDLNIYFNAAARIMKVYGMQMLVDAYNDVPYTDALQGAEVLTPTYDNAGSIYASLAAELDKAVSDIRKGDGLSVKNKIDAYDIVFGGDMDEWVKLANTIKLRLMVRGNGKATFSNTAFDAAGFLTEDALINPGYARDNNRQNPLWNTWGFLYTGAAGNKAWIPSTFIMTYYDGTKLADPGRGKAIYYQFPLTPATGTNQLGYESTGIPKSPGGSFWYPGADRTGTSAGNSTGVMKGPDAGYPMFTAAESYFLLAEAAVVGISTPAGSNAKALFESGITESFKFLYRLPDNTYSGNPISAATTYLTTNASSKLVQLDLALTPAEKIEAIITQKYIALNMVNSHEGWNEYRRTGYPTIFGTAATTTFASIASQSTRPDRLPSRILYPTSETQYNPTNVPAGVSSFNSLIFWAK